MEEARHRTHLALVASGTGLWTTDLVSNTTELDECAASIWGFPAREPIPQSQIEARIVLADRIRRQTALASISDPTDATHFDVEYRISACDPRPERWVAVRGHTEFENGKPRRRFGTVRDISARKAAEKKF